MVELHQHDGDLEIPRQRGHHRLLCFVPGRWWPTPHLIPPSVRSLQNCFNTAKSPSPGLRPPSPGGRGDGLKSLRPPGEGAPQGRMRALPRRRINLPGLMQNPFGLMQNLRGLMRNLFGLMQNLFGLIQNLSGLIQNLSGLMQNLPGLVQNLSGLVQSHARGGCYAT